MTTICDNSRLNQEPASVELFESLALTQGVLSLCDEWLDLFSPSSDDEKRHSTHAEWRAIARADYNKTWNQQGRRLGTPLHRAACFQRRAQETDSLFQSAYGNAATTGYDSRGQPVGLTALLVRAQYDWKKAHTTAVDKDEKAQPERRVTVVTARHGGTRAVPFARVRERPVRWAVQP